MAGGSKKAGDPRLDVLAGSAPRRSPNVRALARFAANVECTLATVGFAARVDFDQLLVGTRFEVPFGQSPFAFLRGNRFEERLRDKGHEPLLSLFRDKLGFDVTDARVSDLRKGAWNRAGMEKRAQRTVDDVRAIVQQDTTAPNLLDGAVLTRDVAGVRSYFEADAVAARFDAPIRVGEIKSFPTVDEQADPEKVGAAVAQVSIYILLMQDLVAQVGGDPGKLVSDEALIITPKNTGLRPTMCVKAVGRHVDRARRILDQAPDATAIADDLPAKLPSFGEVHAPTAPTRQRLDRAQELAETLGTAYRPACLAACGFSRFCRHHAHRRGDIELLGGTLQRLVPGIESIDRVGALAGGAKASQGEQAVAEHLRRAQELKDEFAGGSP